MVIIPIIVVIIPIIVVIIPIIVVIIPMIVVIIPIIVVIIIPIIVVMIPIIVAVYGYMMGYMIILVGGIPTPLKNMSSSGGMMTFPTEWDNNPNVPNHQPVFRWV